MPDRYLKRFVAFAFSAADVLVETDLTGVIAFSAGAVSACKSLSMTPGESRLEDAFEGVSRRVIRTLLETAPEEGRSGPVRVWCEDRAVDLSLWRMRHSQTVQWAIRFAKNSEHDTLPRFPGKARSVLEDARARGDALDLAMVWLDGTNEIRAALGDVQADRFFASLIEIAGMHAEDGAAGSLAENGDLVGLIPADAESLEKLQRELNELARTKGFEHVRSQSRVLATADIPLDDALSVFVEAANRFQETGIPPGENLFAHYVEKACRIVEARSKAVLLTVRKKMFEPYAQPIVDAKTGEAIEYELLVRLPGGQSFAPALILAEQVGLTEELDLAMTRTALDFLKVSPDRPDLSVNLSGASLNTYGFGDHLRALLKDTPIAPRRLCFEITETVAIKDFDRVRAVTEGLRKLGHPVALDDFGAGAAGVEYLIRIPADRVKLDGALLPKTTPSEWERLLFRQLATLAHGLDATIVAEHVEHRWQALMLEQSGIDRLQGYLFGAPEPLSELALRHAPRQRRSSGDDALRETG